MGLWDFAVTLSGSDLPLRSVDDFALALAPHRGILSRNPGDFWRKVYHDLLLFPRLIGESLISFIGFELRNADLRPEAQRHCLEAFLGCGGFSFNVTRMHGQPTVEELQIRCRTKIKI